MAPKKKHLKQLKKLKAKRELEKTTNEPEVDFDTSAYVIYNRLQVTYPCLSFDIVTDDRGSDADRVKKFPLSLYLVAGAQTPPHVESNYIYVMKVNNINPLTQEDENEKDDDEEESEGEDAEDDKKLPQLNSVRVAHKGCVNRVRVNKLSGKTYASSWSDKGKVHVYDLTTPIQAVSDPQSMKTYLAQKFEPKPIFTFGGHLTEGYAMDWAPLKNGSLATGDCKKNIHIWTMKTHNDWNIDQHPLVGHENSVEDIKWSPEEADVLASCSVDKSICFWDLRNQAQARNIIKIPDSHKSDVNVIDWNKRSKNLIVSGGDDGVVKVWDMRYLKKNPQETAPVAQFDYHKKPITSVEWDPNDDTVIAVASEDDRLTLWDLAVERDIEQEEAEQAKPMELEENSDKADNGDKKDDSSSSSSSSEEDADEEDGEEDNDDKMEDDDEENGVEYGLKNVPEQMLFLHQGQAEIKELHWHPQYRGLLISTALNGLNIFKTISA